ncbi:MAG: NTF2 fold immunity protein [Bacillota bacterium]
MKRVLLILLIIVGLLCSCNQQPKQKGAIIVVDEDKQINYKVDTEKTYEPYVGGVDIYNANENELRKENLVKYDKRFGEISDERTAVDVSTIVFNEIYEDCVEKEAPFMVKYNKNAKAWIVHGTLPPNMLGGVASIAIKKETGEILMLMHTK